ncbi:hypothetical protein [Jannaschia aquimarina]|uniref:Uncharacterized protein n=1 Tax=Jannaschia aquimarina TaxID=935700 RepID=A0A0D1EE07_9RHOB|nr:hypothetical protein [Jannaschia aquimarina]KIT15156.1 hypothetical protein jaqu_31250 [Jannaschia aquimarina]SNT23798.1 hypothetical protein SAMN05421775_108148 [Jannaschia aquimarina]
MTNETSGPTIIRGSVDPRKLTPALVALPTIAGAIWFGLSGGPALGLTEPLAQLVAAAGVLAVGVSLAITGPKRRSVPVPVAEPYRLSVGDRQLVRDRDCAVHASDFGVISLMLSRAHDHLREEIAALDGAAWLSLTPGDPRVAAVLNTIYDRLTELADLAVDGYAPREAILLADLHADLRASVGTLAAPVPTHALPSARVH